MRPEGQAGAAERIREFLGCEVECAFQPDAAGQFKRLVDAGLDRIPLPASGYTMERWQALAAVGEVDLSLAKLYEGHTDALTIMAELGCLHLAEAGSSWGVWAAESPQGRLTCHAAQGSTLLLQGRKYWCSGAGVASHALVTAWGADSDQPQLVSVALDQPGIGIDRSRWAAVGMAGSGSFNVTFEGAIANPLGNPGDYLARAGFWQGGGGIAACWFGGCRAIAGALQNTLESSPDSARGPLRMAALGRVALAMHSAACVLRTSARWIDDNPAGNAMAAALQARLGVELCAKEVLSVVGGTLGATPFCTQAHFARVAADLPVFLRQSHGERDFAALGGLALAVGQKHGWL